jgi:hypothetical protein
MSGVWEYRYKNGDWYEEGTGPYPERGDPIREWRLKKNLCSEIPMPEKTYTQAELNEACQKAADDELAATAQWLVQAREGWTLSDLHRARRPKKSLKEEALESYEKILVSWMTNKFSKEDLVKHGTIVRSALNSLPDEE